MGITCRLFFENGEKDVRELLVAAIKEEREKRKLGDTALDELCMLKEDGLATCGQFEADSELLTGKIFCRIAAELELKVDQILKVDFCLPENLDKAVSVIKADKGTLAATNGAPAEMVRIEKVAPIYLMSKILEEI